MFLLQQEPLNVLFKQMFVRNPWLLDSDEDIIVSFFYIAGTL